MKNDHSLILSSPMVHQVCLVVSFWLQASEYLTAQDLYIGASTVSDSNFWMLMNIASSIWSSMLMR